MTKKRLLSKSKKAHQLSAEGKQKIQRKEELMHGNGAQSMDDVENSEIKAGSYIGLTAFITEDTDLLEILEETLASSVSDLSKAEEDKEGRKTGGDDVNFTQENKLQDGSLGNEHRLALVGLHTCGNLASSSIKLFVSNSRVKFMCNVGCCYHLIEEEFCASPFQNKTPEGDVALKDHCSNYDLSEGKQTQNSLLKDEKDSSTTKGLSCHQKLAMESAGMDPLHPSTIPNLSLGFPMSAALRERKFSLERNPRMLSCQATDRLTGHSHNGLDSLYWRALLQVILKDKLGETVENAYNVGRIAAKCSNFKEYTRKAIEKLKLDIMVTDEEICEYQRKYDSESIEKIECFFILRSALAPLIEGFILLDRVAFLKEQGDVDATYLVQLFNPVTSPRCHAIIAVREK